MRKLAERSSASAEEISHLISDTQKDAASAVSGLDRSVAVVDSGREAMHSSLEKFGEIMLSVQGLMTKIEEIAASTEELGASSEEVAASTEEQLAAVEDHCAATGELGTASKFLYEELKNLNSSLAGKSLVLCFGCCVTLQHCHYERNNPILRGRKIL